MSLNTFSAKGVRRLNAEHGWDFLWASVWSDGHIGLGITPTLNVVKFDRRTGETEPYDGMSTSSSEARRVVWALLGGREPSIPL